MFNSSFIWALSLVASLVEKGKKQTGHSSWDRTHHGEETRKAAMGFTGKASGRWATRAGLQICAELERDRMCSAPAAKAGENSSGPSSSGGWQLRWQCCSCPARLSSSRERTEVPERHHPALISPPAPETSRRRLSPLRPPAPGGSSAPSSHPTETPAP